MENLDLPYLCTVIGNLSGVPIRLFRGGEPVFYHSVVKLPRDPMLAYWEDIRRIKEHMSYFTTRHFHYYGVVNSGEWKVVLGPTRQVSGPDQELRELAFRADVPPEEVEDFVRGMKSIVRLPLDSVMQILCTINHVLNGEKLGLDDIAIYEAEQEGLKDALERQRADRALEYPAPNPPVQQNAYGTLSLEQMLTGMVRRGDSEALKKWIAAAPAVRGGVLAEDQLRQMKNTFIVTVTLITRAAIQGGLDAEEAFALSDGFIQKCELLTAMDQITNLQYRMVLEFTERVEQVRLGGQPSRLARQVANYVRQHLSEPISVEDMAKELYVSRPHLSAKFRQETGETLTDFILKEKTEEAKRLLRYTDKTSAAIGAYLGFSSQSYFSRVFKKYVGYTPGEWRELRDG
ncbi:MAG: helix-turn-helix domain-containing protein [Clostridiales bacterium]|nr:helix-turn-helix domain-containing protein [Clostridiales bacterium]